MDATKYYGIYIQQENDEVERDNSDTIHICTSYDEAKKIIKEIKTARFKCFGSKEEATYFAINGSTSGPGNPSVVSESTPFRSLKRFEIYPFRRCIETHNLKNVEKLVWDNPRYLVGIGDTPTIMQEGPRYNALHIAAMYNSFRIAEYILKTISNKEFIQLLYGASGDSSYVVRPEALLDMYLNTPDKVLNETPLHFAAKHGSLAVVRVLIQYPQLQLNVKNKYDQTPKEIVCRNFRAKFPNKVSDADDVNWYTNEIHKLLDEPFYVPVWRSDEDVMQPIIGKPFSPKSPPVYPSMTSPLSPTMEIKAFAGPMSFDEASSFHRTWKSPGKSIITNTPHVTKGVLLRSPLCCNKGLEKVGRTLAKKFHVSWKEYWPFLNDFADLSSETGLHLLEEYLQNVIITTTVEAEKNNFIINTPMSDLCNAFSKCSIVSPSTSSHSSNQEGKNSPSVISPYLCTDNLCSTFAKNLILTFEQNFNGNVPVEDNLPVLIKRIRNLSGTINSCGIDESFRNFPFEKIHARIAYWIRSNINFLNMRTLRYIASIFQLVHEVDTNEIISCISVSPSSSNVELSNIVQTLKCINKHAVKLLKTDYIDESCRARFPKEWFSMECCSCFNRGDETVFRSSSRLYKLKFPEKKLARKLLLFDDSPSTEQTNSKNSPKTNEIEVTNVDSGCDNDNRLRGRCSDACNGDAEDEFFTPPNSVYDSDEDMESPDEGPDLFIYDNLGTSMDNAVLDAIADVNIDRNLYPAIYRWKHSVLLHNNFKRFSWPSPNIEHRKNKKLSS